jgi:hypothetical protein
VLYAFYRPAKGDKQILAMTLDLVKRWRVTLSALEAHGWQARSRSSGNAFAVNCLPAFCFCTPRTAPCKLAAICPFCYAREIGSVYGRFDQTIATLPDPGAWKLVERVKSIREPFLDTPEQRRLAAAAKRPSRDQLITPIAADPEWLAAVERKLRSSLREIVRLRRRWMCAARPYAAYSITTIEAGPECWHIRNRQLLLVPRDARLPPEPPRSPLAEPARIRESTDLSRRSLAKAVARTFAYPRLMLQGSPNLVAVSLRARRRVRLSAGFGALRHTRESGSSDGQ